MDYPDYLESRNLRVYLEQIAKFPTLTEDEEKTVGARIQAGDKDAQRRMVEANLRFVVSYVKKYQGITRSGTIELQCRSP
jgi:RNA polymerase primary sigma factor